MAGTATTREVFVIGRNADGNRTVLVVEADNEYSVAASTAVEYTDDSAEFPYVA